MVSILLHRYPPPIFQWHSFIPLFRFPLVYLAQKLLFLIFDPPGSGDGVGGDHGTGLGGFHDALRAVDQGGEHSTGLGGHDAHRGVDLGVCHDEGRAVDLGGGQGGNQGTGLCGCHDGGDDDQVPDQAEVVDVDQGAVPGEVDD